MKPLELRLPQRFVTETGCSGTPTHIAAQRERRFDRILDVRPIAQPDPAQFADAWSMPYQLGLDALPWTKPSHNGASASAACVAGCRKINPDPARSFNDLIEIWITG